jgi:hypothetical protein
LRSKAKLETISLRLEEKDAMVVERATEQLKFFEKCGQRVKRLVFVKFLTKTGWHCWLKWSEERAALFHFDAVLNLTVLIYTEEDVVFFDQLKNQCHPAHFFYRLALNQRTAIQNSFVLDGIMEEQVDDLDVQMYK